MTEYTATVEVQQPLDINSSGTIIKRFAAATISGTVSCSSPTSVLLNVSVTQAQTKGRNTTTVSGSGSTSLVCSGTTAWSVEVSPESGYFAAGAADATASVAGANPPVQENQTVQLR